MATKLQDISRETLNIETAGKMLGVSRAVAYELARRDQLPVPVIRLGRRMVVSKRALEEVLDARKDDEDAA
jgi:predicted DNA-binding transcriptional regulator AlpA